MRHLIVGALLLFVMGCTPATNTPTANAPMPIPASAPSESAPPNQVKSAKRLPDVDSYYIGIFWHQVRIETEREIMECQQLRVHMDEAALRKLGLDDVALRKREQQTKYLTKRIDDLLSGKEIVIPVILPKSEDYNIGRLETNLVCLAVIGPTEMRASYNLEQPRRKQNDAHWTGGKEDFLIRGVPTNGVLVGGPCLPNFENQVFVIRPHEIHTTDSGTKMILRVLEPFDVEASKKYLPEAKQPAK